MNPTFCEDDSSQVPALLLLQRLGYTYLSPAEALVLRGGKTSGVLLEGILRQQLHRLNVFRHKDRSYPFSETNLSNAIYALQDYPLQEGYLAANQHLYNLLTLGKSFEETVLGDKKAIPSATLTSKTPPIMFFTSPKNSACSGRTAPTAPPPATTAPM